MVRIRKTRFYERDVISIVREYIGGGRMIVHFFHDTPWGDVFCFGGFPAFIDFPEKNEDYDLPQFHIIAKIIGELKSFCQKYRDLGAACRGSWEIKGYPITREDRALIHREEVKDHLAEHFSTIDSREKLEELADANYDDFEAAVHLLRNRRAVARSNKARFGRKK